VIQSFADKTTAGLFREENARPARQAAKEIWRIVQRKLKWLDAAAQLDDLAASPGSHLEPLKGGQAGRHSIRVNDQFRVTFRWENGSVYQVSVEDHH
jgi:proteic killer suppression protein